MVGTLVNMGAVAAGSAIGILVHSRLPKKYVDIVFQGIGLFTIALGISMSLKSGNMLLLVLSIVSGAIIGQAIDIETGMDKLGKYFQNKFRKKSECSDSGNFTEGFLTATMLYCVGSMSILGAFEDGTGQTPTLLYTKSIMDGVSSIALASSFGISVAFSIIPMFVYQGLLTLFASYLTDVMTDAMIADFTAVGGILLIGLGINILNIKKISVMNLLPALVIILLLSYYFG